MIRSASRMRRMMQISQHIVVRDTIVLPGNWKGWRACINNVDNAFKRASDFGPRGPWFEPRPAHISLWP